MQIEGPKLLIYEGKQGCVMYMKLKKQATESTILSQRKNITIIGIRYEAWAIKQHCQTCRKGKHISEAVMVTLDSSMKFKGPCLL